MIVLTFLIHKTVVKILWKTDLEELCNDNPSLRDIGTTPLTDSIDMCQGQSWGTRRGRPWAGEHGMQVLVLRGLKKTSANSDKHLDLLLPLFWSKFIWSMITTCKLFMPLSVKPACEIQLSVSS